METQETAETIAAALHDPNIPFIGGLIEKLGQERCQILVTATLSLESHGGTIHSAGKIRRTPGETFFKLAMACCTKKQRVKLAKRFPRPGPPQEHHPHE